MALESVTSKIAISTTTTFTTGYENKGGNLSLSSAPMVSDGMRGTRSRIDGRTRFGLKTVQGSLSFDPTPEELANLLPWILGGNASGTSYPLAETLTSRYVAQEMDSSCKWSEFSGVYVNRAVFSASEGGVLSLGLDLIGTDETLKTAGTFPSVTFGETTPFVFHDCSGGSSIFSEGMNIKNLQLTIDNQLAARFFNSRTATSIKPRDRIITFSCGVEMSNANYNTLYGAEAAQEIDVQFTNGAYSLRFVMPYVRAAFQTPSIPNRDEILYQLNGQALRSGSTMELSTTLDSTA